MRTEWHTQTVADGHDVEAIDAAIKAAKADPRPSIISVKTTIGYGLPTRAGTAKAHGEPPGEEELRGAKQALGWPLEPDFYVPEDVAEFFLQAVENGATLEADWNAALAAYSAGISELGAEMKRILAGKLPANWQDALPEFETDEKGMATRAASGKVLNALAPILPDLLGGSADLAPSNKTWIDGEDYFHAGAYGSRNFHFGVREHGMGAIVNGMSLYPGILPYGGTFLVFSDYMHAARCVSVHYRIITPSGSSPTTVSDSARTAPPISRWNMPPLCGRCPI